MRKYDRMSALFWLGMGLFIAWQGYGLRLGTLKEPGPGFLIFWGGVILSGLSALTFVKSQIASEDKSEKIWAKIQWSKPLWVILACIGYTFFFARLGYLLSTFLLMCFLFKFAGSPKWGKVLFASFLSVLLSWLIFDTWLQSQFPRGLLESLMKKY